MVGGCYGVGSFVVGVCTLHITCSSCVCIYLYFSSDMLHCWPNGNTIYTCTKFSASNSANETRGPPILNPCTHIATCAIYDERQAMPRQRNDEHAKRSNRFRVETTEYLNTYFDFKLKSSIFPSSARAGCGRPNSTRWERDSLLRFRLANLCKCITILPPEHIVFSICFVISFGKIFQVSGLHQENREHTRPFMEYSTN